MISKPSSDYHDYVFRDGRLVGDFDNMYRYSKDVPWNQDKHCRHWYTGVGMVMLKEYAPYDRVLEIGCGLGYISTRLKKLAQSVDAFDVSPVAVKAAKKRHKGIQFYVADISSTAFRPRKKYNLVVIRDVFWYLFPKMETVIRNINACVVNDGLLYIAQSFPALDRPFVGKDVISDPQNLLSYFSNYRPVLSASLRHHSFVNDGPILHHLATKSK